MPDPRRFEAVLASAEIRFADVDEPLSVLGDRHERGFVARELRLEGFERGGVGIVEGRPWVLEGCGWAADVMGFGSCWV